MLRLILPAEPMIFMLRHVYLCARVDAAARYMRTCRALAVV